MVIMFVIVQKALHVTLHLLLLSSPLQNERNRISNNERALTYAVSEGYSWARVPLLIVMLLSSLVWPLT